MERITNLDTSKIDSDVSILNELVSRLVGNAGGDDSAIKEAQDEFILAFKQGKYDQPIEFSEQKKMSIRELLQEGQDAFKALVVGKVGGEQNIINHQKTKGQIDDLLNIIEVKNN